MSFYDKLEFTKDGRLKRGEMKKLTEEEKHQYYLDYHAKYYAKMRANVRKNKKVKNEDGTLLKNNDFLKSKKPKGEKICLSSHIEN
jgi:hypothetical protein